LAQWFFFLLFMIKYIIMKNYFIFNLIALFFIMMNCNLRVLADIETAAGNSGKYRLLRLHYKNASGERGVTTFEYNQKGHMVKALWQLLDGSRNSLNFYTYDKKGNLVKKYREFSDAKTSTQLFEYDGNGNLIFEDFKRSDGVKGRTGYDYDTNGKLVQADCKGLNGWFFGVIKYKYDKNGRKTRADIEREGKKVGIINYTYGENGNLVEEYWDFPGNWSQTFTYEYDQVPDTNPKPYTSSNVFINTTSGYKVVKEDYNYSNKSGGPSFYQYDDHGKLVRKIFKRSDGLKTVTDFFYDADNKLIKSLRRYADGKSGIFTYEYNEDRKLINRTFKHIDGSTASETYEYGSSGKLVTAVWDKFDTWLTGTITFDYDKKGYLSTGHFKGNGEKNFDAEITFKHDKNKNLRVIHWDFSFKGTQTYTFGYDK
jgi:hypothetical protein